MEQLRLAVEAPLRVGEMEIHPTLVLAEVNAGPESDADELLRQAEALVGAHKAQDRAKHSIQPALVGDSLSHLTLESDLRGAVERGEIEAFFQPIARLDNGQLAGFEALVRWRHPRRGLLPPDDFLPLVGEVGLMQELGLYMVQSAAREVSSWRRLNPYCKDLFVSVNLTTGDLERNSLVKEVGDIIAAAGLPDGALKLEITEGEVMRDADQAASLLTELKTVGARISLDDFGMGFSSLSWLARLPIQCLKIDRYFVRTMASSEGSEKIVRSIINLARDFDLEVVAEGVESQTIADTLAAIGCEFGQGFAYAPPMSSEEVLVYLIECSLDGSAFRIPRG
jgi:c-di-GMP-specific phosphodiesterase